MSHDFISINAAQAEVLVISDAGVVSDAFVCASRMAAILGAWNFFACRDSDDDHLRAAKNKLDSGQLDEAEEFLETYCSECSRFTFSIQSFEYLP